MPFSIIYFPHFFHLDESSIKWDFVSYPVLQSLSLTRLFNPFTFNIISGIFLFEYAIFFEDGIMELSFLSPYLKRYILKYL